MNRSNSWEKKGIYSLIFDLEQDTTPLRVTATFDLGTIINRLSRDWICIGSGEKLGEKEIYKCEEIRCSIVRKDDLKTVRNIFEKKVQLSNTLENGQELVIKGLLGTPDNASPIVRTVNDETLISVLLNNTPIQVRFLKENLKFIRGLDLQQEGALQGIEIYVCGLALQTDNQSWEILGRSLLPVEEE